MQDVARGPMVAWSPVRIAVAALSIASCNSVESAGTPAPVGGKTGGGGGGTAGARPGGGGGADGGMAVSGRGGMAMGGSGGMAMGGSGGMIAQPPAGTPRIAITEIMYHPVLENDAQDNHEFIELFNTGDSAVALKDWKLYIDRKMRLVFPADASIGPKKWLVVAKQKAKLLEVKKWGLAAGDVVGDYVGELANGGGQVALLDDKGATVDAVEYDDRAPWPIGADALGASEDWLPTLAPFSAHQYMGRSIERWSVALAGNDPRNWEASPVDGSTPGRANTVSGEPPGIVLAIDAGPDGAMGLIKPANKIALTVKLSEGALSDLAIEYRVDTAKGPGMVRNAKLDVTGLMGKAVLDAQAANSVVQYRVIGKRGTAVGPVSPRAGDPFDFHATFVNPDNLPATRTYQIVIAPKDWNAMWTNLSYMGVVNPNGGLNGCGVNPTWDKRLPAVFVFDGKVYDVRVRYQGSRFQRKNGLDLPATAIPAGLGPTEPAPNGKVFSWRVSFPRYTNFEGRGTINLNKQFQACPGVLNVLEGKLYAEAGVPTNKFRFLRMHVNGGYYAYMMEVENIDEAFVPKYLEPGSSAVGDLFKNEGALADNGPWARGDFKPIASHPKCPEYSVLTRYQTTYERQTHTWKDLGPAGHEELIKMIDEMAVVRADIGQDAKPETRAFFEKYFDIQNLLSHWVVRNFAGVWDDGAHNYYFYKRASDGKWMILPQDFDLDFGGDPTDMQWAGFAQVPSLSMFHGEQGDGKIAGGVNDIKPQFIRAFRAEFVARAEELLKTKFTEAAVNKMLDDSMVGFNVADWMAAPVRRCDLAKRVDMARDWLKQRYVFLQAGIK